MKRTWENGHKGVNWGAREMSDVGCDTQVLRQLSPGATFGSLQSYVCRSGPVAAFTQSPAALTPLINSKRKRTRWTITSLFCWVAQSSCKTLVIDTDIRDPETSSASLAHRTFLSKTVLLIKYICSLPTPKVQSADVGSKCIRKKV